MNPVLHQRFLELIPGPADLLAGSLGAVGFSLGVVAALSCRTLGLKTRDTRKLLHLVVFTTAAILRTNGPVSTVVVFGFWGILLLLGAVVRGRGNSLFESIARPEDGAHRTWNVIFSLSSTALGGVLSHLLVGRGTIVGLLVTGYGDACGEIVGSRHGKHPLSLPQKLFGRRTLEGSLAVLLASFVAASIGLFLTGHRHPSVLFPAVVIALVATLAEAISPPGTDNFTIQLAVALALLAL